MKFIGPAVQIINDSNQVEILVGEFPSLHSTIYKQHGLMFDSSPVDGFMTEDNGFMTRQQVTEYFINQPETPEFWLKFFENGRTITSDAVMELIGFFD